MTRRQVASLLTLTLAGAVAITLALLWPGRHPKMDVAHAALYQTTFNASQSLQDSSGGMAQYGYAMQQATSLSADTQATANWNTYISSRCGWSMSSTAYTRLATGDWNARQAGPPSISPQQLANAVNHLINSVLSTMTATQQIALLRQNDTLSTPKGAMGLQAEIPINYISANQNADGTWTVTVSPDLFAKRKSFFQSYAPGMVSSSANFYPAETMLVTYSLAAGDRGFGDSYVSRAKTLIGDLSGLDMTNAKLYGPSGYLNRRPLDIFFTDATLGQFFSDLGF